MCVLRPHLDNDVKKLISVNQKRGEGYPFNSFPISLAFNCNFKCYSILLTLMIQLSLAAGCLSGPYKNCLVRESVRGSPVRLLWWGGIRLLRSVAQLLQFSLEELFISPFGSWRETISCLKTGPATVPHLACRGTIR